MKEISLDSLTTLQDIDTLISSFWDTKNFDICVSYSSDFLNTRKIRELVDRLCVSHSVSPKWRARLVLIVDELNNNAIEYGSIPWDVNTFRFTMSYECGVQKVIILVSDTGNGHDSKGAMEMKEIQEKFTHINYAKHDSIRGRGLFLIINHLVDSLEFLDSESGWLTVKVEKKLS